MREPRQTCAEINDVQGRIRDFAGQLRVIADDMDHPHYSTDLIAELEDLRSQNEQLRDWGNHWRDRAEELEKELEEALQGADA